MKCWYWYYEGFHSFTVASCPLSVRESTFGKMSYLQPLDTRQYLYCLKPKPEYAEKAGVIKGVTVIGKLDIVWKTNLGERGRLQTSQLQRMVCHSPGSSVGRNLQGRNVTIALGVAHRLRGTGTSGCRWRWSPTPSTWRSLLTSSVKSPTAGETRHSLYWQITAVMSSLMIALLCLPQWTNHGPGAGDVQHPVHPLVRRLRSTAGEAQPRRVPLSAPHTPLLHPGSAGTSPTRIRASSIHLSESH